jgi:3-oxoacyl-[acyl-carrier protein] reductase
MDYHGKVALVTGASSGLGAGISRRLAALGAHVFLVARRTDLLEQLAADITHAGGQATAVTCDVTDEQAVRSLAAVVKGRFGCLHLLVNNAGRPLGEPLQVLRLDKARAVLELNVLAMASVTKAMLGLLKPGAAVVNMASAAAFRGAATMSLYAASKGAVVAMTRALALELASRQIRVNAVAPGVVRTELFQQAFGRFSPAQIAALESQHPLGLGEVEDVAAAVAFLGSQDARWITGHTLVVDGGFSA